MEAAQQPGGGGGGGGRGGGTAYKMPLPSGIQFIIGMPTMVELDLWLHPASKRIKILQDQRDVTLNFMAAPELISEFQTRSKPRAGLYHMSSTGDAVDGIGISKTACGNEIEYMTDRKAFSKLLAAYEQGSHVCVFAVNVNK